MSEDSTNTQAAPAIRVLAGNPTDGELAVVISLLAHLPHTEIVQPNPPSHWSERAAMMRPVLSPGPGAWRASAFPQQ